MEGKVGNMKFAMAAVSSALVISGLTYARGASTTAPAEIRQKDSAWVNRKAARMDADTRYLRFERRLDSLWNDSLEVWNSPGSIYRRVLDDARTARDHTKVALELWKTVPDNSASGLWESSRAQTEMSLDSLERILISADSISNSERTRRDKKPSEGKKKAHGRERRQ